MARARAPAPRRGTGAANGERHDGHGTRKDDGPAATAVGDIKETLPGMAAAGCRGVRVAGGACRAYFNEKPLATPATRKLARDMNVDLAPRPADAAPRAASPSATSKASRAPPAPAALARAHARARALARPLARARPHRPRRRLEERVPFAGMRRKIAQKMAQSKHTAAHFTFVEECDVTALKALRARLKARRRGGRA